MLFVAKALLLNDKEILEISHETPLKRSIKKSKYKKGVLKILFHLNHILALKGQGHVI